MILLSPEKRLAVLAGLVEGNSERAVERMTGVNRETVGRFALRFGEGARRLHDRLVRDLSCGLVDVDEMWAFCTKKGSRVTPQDSPEVGEAWTWVALDRTSRLAIAFVVGRRDQETADAFVEDLRSRLVTMPKLMTSDGLSLYEPAIARAFGPGVDYAQTIKNYKGAATRGPDHRYEPPRGMAFITKKAVLGAPDLDKATTYAVERNNGTLRHHIGRMRRLSLAFSKKMTNHKAAVALNYVHYNLCLISKPLRMTPAMAAGVVDRLWSLEDLCEVLLSEPEGARPERKPLAHRVPEGTARELPGGRGWLRIVGGSKGPGPAAPLPPPAPAPGTATTGAAVPPTNASAVPPDAPRQLELFAWKPRARPLPPKGTQLMLFEAPEED